MRLRTSAAHKHEPPTRRDSSPGAQGAPQETDGGNVPTKSFNGTRSPSARFEGNARDSTAEPVASELRGGELPAQPKSPRSTSPIHPTRAP